MKKIYLLFLTALCLFGANAQVASYTFTQSSGTYTPITGGTLVASQTTATGTSAAALDDVNYSVALPFDFTYNGFSYASGTNIYINSNGFIAFGAATTTNNYTPVSGPDNNTIAPFGVDCNGGWAVTGTTASGSPTITAISNTAGYAVGAIVAGTGIPAGSTILSVATNTSITISANCTSSGTGRTISCASGQIRAQQVGSTFVIQYRNFRPYNTSGKLINAQVVLHQTTNTIDVVYGTVVLTGTTNALQVGLRGAAATDYNNRTGTDWTASTAGGSSTAAMVLGAAGGTTVPAPGQTYTWTPSACPAPSLTIGNIGSGAATATWSGTGTFIIEYGLTGFTPGTGATAGTGGTVINPATSPQAISGLSAATAYQVYVRQNCTVAGNGYSANSTVVNFTTLCTPGSVPYLMPIDGITEPALPSCTSMENINTDISTWKSYAGIGGISGYNYPVLGYRYNEDNNANDWLYTRGLTLTAGTSYTLTFKYGNDGTTSGDPLGYYPEKLKVMYGTNATVASMTLPLADFPTVANAIPQGTVINFTPAASGTYYIGFQAYSDADQDFLILDDISVVPTPVCQYPVAVVASAITGTTASISFTPATAGSYIVEYGPAGFTPGTGATAGATGTVVTGTTSPIGISGLSSSTTYDVYVRQNCTANGYSDNSIRHTFTTNGDCATAPAITCGTPITAAYNAGTGAYNTNSCFGDTPGNEQIYSFTPTVTGEYVLEVLSTTSDYYVDYTIKDVADGGCDENNWECMDFMDSPGEVGTLNLVAGTTYLIMADAEDDFGGYSQTFQLRCAASAPTNDDAPGAIALTVNAGCTTAGYTNDGATHPADEPFASCAVETEDATHTVWYKFVAGSTAVKVSTDGIAASTLDDTQIALFSATDVADYSTFNVISCDDDGGSTGSLKSVLYATGLTIGQTYYIEVDGYSGEVGTFCLTVDDLNSSMLATAPTCADAGQAPTASIETYTGQTSLLDANSNLIAIVTNPAGGGASDYSVAHNKNTGAVRQDAGGNYYLDRNYLITNSTATNVQVQFFFTNAELAALTAVDPSITLTNLGAFRQSGTVCNPDYVSGTGTALTQNAFGSQGGLSWIQVTTPSFSNFYLTKAATVLPIRIEYFRGATQGSVNVLDWKVNSTDPSVTISLERSADGRSFGSVYSLSATAARCLQPFDHTDADPLQVNYYRLKITDVSGKISYSQVVVLLGKGRSFELIGLLPNPVLGSAQLNITSASSTRMEIRVTDIAGKTISNQTVNVIAGANKIPMNFSKLASGTYQVTGKTADGALRTIRFVKQ